MKTVRLGKTGLEVSRIGMGGIPITRPSMDEAVKVIHRALDLGVNFIDTSPGYKDSEERIGKAIADRRDQVIIATKTYDDKATTLKCLERSLKRFNTDYIDLWQFLNVSNFENYERVLGPGGGMEAAQGALEAGKIRHIGISTHSLDVALKAVSSGYFETIMFPFNFVANEAAEKLVPLAREHDVGFLAMKPFAGGMLKNANLVIKYLLQFDNVLPNPGIEKVEEIEEIVDIVNGSWELTSQERQEMEEIRAELSARLCRQCEYCQPCLQGVRIVSLINIRILWKLWSPEWLLSLRYVTDAVESWKNCNQCGECEERCPYHLPILKMIAENIKFYESVAQGKVRLKPIGRVNRMN
jgi:predicted aldo/keto reductase-like oxidoreductase